MIKIIALILTVLFMLTFVACGGTAGKDGSTPYIQDGYWYVNGVNTGVQAQGEPGETPVIKKGYWYVDGVHPSLSGYYQIADAAFRSLCEIFSK